MGYQLRTRWLEWHNFTPMPDIESLKRQIETIKREIILLAELSDGPDIRRRIDDLSEVLATLERLMPQF
jgi:hypothetical protein